MIEDIVHLGLIDEEEIELDAAAIEIAALDHPEADLDDYGALLDEMGDSLLARAAIAETSTEQAEALAAVIAEQYGFEGDRDSYDDPHNADLISVLDRRRGLPVSLAILYVALARRIGWSAQALNTPGHVLVGIGEDRLLLIDPFNRGDFVRPEQLANLLQSVLGRSEEDASEHLAPMSNRAVLVRLLNNQASRAEQAGQHRRALTVHERITTVAPAHSHGWWERARIELLLGDKGAAKDSLCAMLETTRDADMRAHVKSVLETL